MLASAVHLMWKSCCVSVAAPRGLDSVDRGELDTLVLHPWLSWLNQVQVLAAEGYVVCRGVRYHMW